MNLARRRSTPTSLLLIVAALIGFTPSLHSQAERIREVVVIGNKQIGTDAIMRAVKVLPNTDLDPQRVNADVEAIRSLGFFHDVRSHTEPAPTGGVKVIYAVVENPRVTAIKISGNTVISTPKIQGAMVTQVGSVFNDVAFQKDVDAIQRLYRQQGFVLARVTEDYGPTPDGVVNIPIAEGWIESIKLINNKKTKNRVILREMETKPGDVYNALKLQDDLRNLQNLGFFEAPSIEPTPGSEPGKAALVINCKEQKTGTVQVGMGYSSRERLVGFAEVRDTNFRGLGQTVSARWEAGQFTNRSGYELSFEDPWALGKRTSLGVNLYDNTTNRPWSDTWIAEARKGVSVSVGRPVSKYTRLLLDLRSDDVKYGDVSGFAPPPADLLASDGRVTSVTLRSIRNTRDINIDPHRGALDMISSEFAGGPLGGHWSYIKLGADLRRYIPLGKPWLVGGAPNQKLVQKVLATRVMGGVGLGGVPLSENYWVGGAETLRGYREDEFHGTRSLLWSTEFRYPFSELIQGVAFFDYGYAWPKGIAFNLSDMKPAVGLGVRIVTPLGPLRLDYGFGREGGRSHFSIGHVF